MAFIAQTQVRRKLLKAQNKSSTNTNKRGSLSVYWWIFQPWKTGNFQPEKLDVENEKKLSHSLEFLSFAKEQNRKNQHFYEFVRCARRIIFICHCSRQINFHLWLLSDIKDRKFDGKYRNVKENWRLKDI